MEKLAPHADRAVLENALADVAEAMAYQGASRQPQAAARGSAIRLRFNSIPDVSSAITILRIEGAMLEPKQILELARLIEEAGEVRAALNLAGEKYPRLAAQVAGTADPRADTARCARQSAGAMARWRTTRAWRCIACAGTSSGSRGRFRLHSNDS